MFNLFGYFDHSLYENATISMAQTTFQSPFLSLYFVPVCLIYLLYKRVSFKMILIPSYLFLFLYFYFFNHTSTSRVPISQIRCLESLTLFSSFLLLVPHRPIVSIKKFKIFPLNGPSYFEAKCRHFKNTISWNFPLNLPVNHQSISNVPRYPWMKQLLYHRCHWLSYILPYLHTYSPTYIPTHQPVWPEKIAKCL